MLLYDESNSDNAFFHCDDFVSRSQQQLARLVQELIRQIRSGRISAKWVVGLIALAVVYLLLQPVLERSLGIDLPGFCRSCPSEFNPAGRRGATVGRAGRP